MAILTKISGVVTSGKLKPLRVSGELVSDKPMSGKFISGELAAIF